MCIIPRNFRFEKKNVQTRELSVKNSDLHIPFSVCIFLSSYFTTIWQHLIVSRAASCSFLVTPAAHAESTKTGVPEGTL